MKFWLALCLLLVTAHLQSIVIRNLGCKTFDLQQQCIQCSTRYYLDSAAICQPVNPNCNTYNSTTGACLSCYPGFGLIETTCLPGVVTNSFDVNCNQFNGSICVKCSSRFYKGADGKCMRVSASCRTYNPNNGACTGCYAGYEVKNGICVVAQSTPAIANCNEIDSTTGLCKKCSYGYYFNGFGQCVQKDPNCKTFDTSSQQCMECYPGYELKSNQCVEGVAPGGDPNCKTFTNGVCQQCSTGAIFNSNRTCIIVNPECATFDPATGLCTSCYSGYELNAFGGCKKGVAPAGDPNCKTFSNGVCQQCSKGAIFNANKVCVIIDPSCRQFDSATGFCTSCYPGYELSSSRSCIKSASPNGDPNCRSFVNNICQECAKGAIFNSQGICTIVNPSCLTYNDLNGACTSCYPGYEVTSFGGCAKSKAAEGDPNCKIFNSQGVCQECSKGAIFNPFNVCIIVDPSCLTHDQSDVKCTSCYPGYELSSSRTCVKSTAPSGDPNCRTFNNNICIECSKGSIFNIFGVCIIVDASCLTFDENDGACTSCYPGYAVSGKICLKANITDGRDPFCKQFLQDTDVCVECSTRYFINGFGFCQEVNPLCNTYDTLTGNCQTCYPGFELSGVNCIKATRSISDNNCKKWNGPICEECSYGAYFKADGTCALADPICKTFNPINGACTSCYDSFMLSGSTCVKSTVDVANIDPNCAQFKGNICQKCSKNHYFGTGGICTTVNPLCNGFNPLNGACTGCFQSFVLIGRDCVEDKNHTLTDPNCAEWLSGVCVRCATRAFVNNSGLCQIVSKDCNTYNPLNGYCTSCYPGFDLGFGGVCAQAVSPSSCSKFNPDGSCAQCATGSYLSQGQCIIIDPQCAAFDINSKTCTSCYPGYSILNGACQISKVDAQFQIKNCYAYDSSNMCIKCYNRFYYEAGQCKSVNVFCKTHDDFSNTCTSCYTTFTLKDGQCVQ